MQHQRNHSAILRKAGITGSSITITRQQHQYA
jgi:hypothetical protein